MPQQFASGDELSLRHLPDVSDSSFSFQIPGMIQEENLLSEADPDFFGGADVTLAPLVASPPITTTSGGPLTISQLSPSKAASRGTYKQFTFSPATCDRVEVENAIPSPRKATKTRLERKKLPTTVPTSKGSIPRPKRRHDVIMPSVLHLPPGEGSPAIARLQNLRAEVELLDGDLKGGGTGSSSKNVPQEPLFPTNTIQKPSGTSRKSVEGKELPQRGVTDIPQRSHEVEGRIAKSRFNRDLSRIPCPDTVHVGIVPLQQAKIEQEQDVPASLLPDLSSPEFSGDASPSIANTSLASLAFRGGVAERLVSYSQKLIGSFGIFGPEESMGVLPHLNNGSQDLKAGTDDNDHAGKNPPQQEKNHEPETSNEMDTAIDIASDGPLTLSQLSPSKISLPPGSLVCPSPTITLSAVSLGSPSRPSTKRPVSTQLEGLEDDQPQHRRKRSKIDQSSDVAPPVANNNRRAPAPLHHFPAPHRPDSQRRTKPLASGSGSASGSSNARSRPITVPRKVVKQGKERGRDRPRDREARKKVREQKAAKQIPLVSKAPQSQGGDDIEIGGQDCGRETIGKKMGVGMVASSEREPPGRTCVRLNRTKVLSKQECDKDKDAVGPVNSLSSDPGQGAVCNGQGDTSIAKPSRAARLYDMGPVQGQTQPTVIAEGRSTSSQPQSQSSNRYQLRSTESTSEMVHQHASSSQSQSRSASQREKYPNLHPVPDFNAIHRAHQASMALRKENIQPTVPLPIIFSTDLRVKERQKFDEMVKEKERQKAREEEERRRARQEEEEMEVKELRKRLVVKAHEVPEWYREASRTKRRERDGDE